MTEEEKRRGREDKKGGRIKEGRVGRTKKNWIGRIRKKRKPNDDGI